MRYEGIANLKPIALYFISLLFSLEVTAAVELRYQILETHDHDVSLFTQGLIKTPKGFYESSGLYRRSKLVFYNQSHSTPLKKQHLAGRYFAEGLTLFNDRLYLLTWKAGKSFVYQADTFKPIETLRYNGQGWGLTHDGKHLIMSDGSHKLTFRNPQDFSVIKTLPVHLQGMSWPRLNELEFIQGQVWANTWQDNRIITINPESGLITGILDLSPIVNKHQGKNRERVLNGIAYDKEKEAVWVTGKYWPTLYLLKVIDD